MELTAVSYVASHLDSKVTFRNIPEDKWVAFFSDDDINDVWKKKSVSGELESVVAAVAAFELPADFVKWVKTPDDDTRIYNHPEHGVIRIINDPWYNSTCDGRGDGSVDNWSIDFDLASNDLRDFVDTAGGTYWLDDNEELSDAKQIVRDILTDFEASRS